MKLLPVLFLLILLCSCSNNCKNVYIEAESFDNIGGWSIDPQFSDFMGSPYLIAHGIGKPVDDAVTKVSLPDSGRWNLYVRTYNWTSPWCDKMGPGRFEIMVDDNKIGNEVQGCSLDKWDWEYVGAFQTSNKSIKITLHDLTGFDGRVDAIYLTKGGKEIKKEKETISSKQQFDLVVVGGGIAGICTSVSASRLGLKVALINDFEKLGGNNSSLVRVHLGGKICQQPYPALGNLIKEFGHSKPGNAQSAENYEDWKKDSIIASEENIKVFTPFHFIKAENNGSSIKSVLIKNNRTGELISLSAPLFADCTGDASLGVSVGAEYRYGREATSLTGEKSAPSISDSLIMGGSIQWNTKIDSTSFPDFHYGVEFSDESVERLSHGDWMWETGMNKDMIKEAERIRDYGMLVVYSNWSYLKNHLGYFPDRNLDWVSYVLGKRESRRLMGDFILSETDVVNHKLYDDGSAVSTWSIDLHYPDPKNTTFFPGNEFKSICTGVKIEPYPIPYRCFYSKNIDNLFMAGRNISVTHIALGTTRVMRTCGMMGEVVGMAASICNKYNIKPREVYQSHLDELKELMAKGTGDPNAIDNQGFN